jgi:DNA-binding NarL/FixJ family response regulator
MHQAIFDEVTRRVSALAKHHVDTLTRREQDVLFLEYHGFEVHELATLLGTSPHTVKNQLRSAHAAVAPEPLPASRAVAVVWVREHKACCMAGLFALLTLCSSA